MIAKLRKRFIFIAMGSMILVLVVLMGIINVANFVIADRGSAEILQILSKNNGGFPAMEKPSGSQSEGLDGTPGTNPAGTADGTGGSSERRQIRCRWALEPIARNSL